MFACVCANVFDKGKGQEKRHDAAVPLTWMTLGGGGGGAGQQCRIRVTQDQRALVTDSVSHAAPLASEVYFRGTDTNLRVLSSAAGCFVAVQWMVRGWRDGGGAECCGGSAVA